MIKCHRDPDRNRETNGRQRIKPLEINHQNIVRMHDIIEALVVFIISIHVYAEDKREMEELSMVALSGCIWLQAFVVTMETNLPPDATGSRRRSPSPAIALLRCQPAAEAVGHRGKVDRLG
ncbi:hypothetical protein EJ110_NYTH56284 [Nymphaea thermarum]|nr:hypothetical protein EJ110_NYTH56284 [Nymphaea thermarum]